MTAQIRFVSVVADGDDLLCEQIRNLSLAFMSQEDLVCNFVSNSEDIGRAIFDFASRDDGCVTH
jgi:hypothetical protein